VSAHPAAETARTKGAWAQWQRLRVRWGGVVAQGVLWTTGGYGLAQVLRLVSNLVMTRLLTPEAFGLMAIVDTLLVGLLMLSDTGIGPTLVQRRDAPERALLDTAWSIQALRGALLYGAMLALAAPLARWYETPVLVPVLTVAGARLLVEGFQSTAIFEAMRTMRIRRLVVFETIAQVSGLAVMIGLAWIIPSVWALVWGGLFTSVVRLLASHWMFPRRGSRLRWTDAYVRELVRFGRWLLPSTILLFVILRSDRLLLARWISVGDLGAYNIACFVPLTVVAVAGLVSQNVLFPLFARMRDRGASPLRSEITRKRLSFLAFTTPVLCATAVFGDRLVEVLYDSRYHEAGWMLRVLSCGAIVACANESSFATLLALGDAYRRFIALCWSAAFFLTAILTGSALAGEVGLVSGVAAAPFGAYPFVSWALRKHGVWTARLDLGVFCGAFVAIACLTALRGAL
jgi:O-antigen/teichoic acid export membrane protein